jgi:hypothetical protein
MPIRFRWPFYFEKKEAIKPSEPETNCYNCANPCKNQTDYCLGWRHFLTGRPKDETPSESKSKDDDIGCLLIYESIYAKNDIPLSESTKDAYYETEKRLNALRTDEARILCQEIISIISKNSPAKPYRNRYTKKDGQSYGTRLQIYTESSMAGSFHFTVLDGLDVEGFIEKYFSLDKLLKDHIIEPRTEENSAITF